MTQILKTGLKMATKSYKGKLSIDKSECNLELSLLGGQSFRWDKRDADEGKSSEYRGVACNVFWVLKQNTNAIDYEAFPSKTITNKETYFENLLRNYLRFDFNLRKHVDEWKSAHKHFGSISTNLKAVRVLNQEPLENILSFICSQNNNIKRISSMIKWLCSNYGEFICEYEGEEFYSFPSLNSLLNSVELEAKLREAKFGYRAKFIAQTVKAIHEKGGEKWLKSLSTLPYEEARIELITLPGIGPKVADCICLMSLNHLEAVPIDTHIYKVAKSFYLPELANVKSVTPAIYSKISKHFQEVYGIYAGWAQAVLFCSELQQFNETKQESSDSLKSKSKDIKQVNVKKKRSR